MTTKESWTNWNVALWIANDEPLYRLAMSEIRLNNKPQAARNIVHQLKDMGVEQTPDGAKYTYTSVRHALVGL